MTRRSYLNWMIRLVYDRKVFEDHNYSKLFHLLDSVEFTYILPKDANRASDGITLRYRFGDDQGIPDAVIASVIDISPCSVMEMLAALANRCEESIMGDSQYGDRTSVWFHTMIFNLGLGDMYNENFDEEHAIECLDRFMNRGYSPDGRNGGLFVVENPPADMRTVEFWCQAMWYFSDICKGDDYGVLQG